MNQSVILKPIGKGQYTPPLKWRKLLGIDKKPVRAILENGRIILEPIKTAKLEWDVKEINLDQLNDETIATIKKSEANYKAGNFDKFKSHDDFWDEL
jgi:bifunctional DNA-binding transcriptional regulator/antitoxin component of YhaV-PrlF toxin-antitoxin module